MTIISNSKKPLSVTKAVNLNVFNSLWHNSSPWFESPNIRRGGWSGVVKCSLSKAFDTENVFIKRQENHVTRTLRHPIKGVPTFYREYCNIKLLQLNNISTLDVLYFEMNASKAIMVTKELVGFKGLNEISIKDWKPEDRKLLLISVAKELRKLHQNHFQHGCLYPKHIMVNKRENSWQIKLIDLEKLKYSFFKNNAVMHDLSSLFRYIGGQWSAKDKVQFFKAYFDELELTGHSKNTIRLLNKKIRRKALQRNQADSASSR